MSDVLVTDLPLWDDAPMICDAAEIRRGIAHGIDTIVFREPSTDYHVALDAKKYLPLTEDTINAALRNLQGYHRRKVKWAWK